MQSLTVSDPKSVSTLLLLLDKSNGHDTPLHPALSASLRPSLSPAQFPTAHYSDPVTHAVYRRRTKRYYKLLPDMIHCRSETSTITLPAPPLLPFLPAPSPIPSLFALDLATPAAITSASESILSHTHLYFTPPSSPSSPPQPPIIAFSLSNSFPRPLLELLLPDCLNTLDSFRYFTLPQYLAHHFLLALASPSCPPPPLLQHLAATSHSLQTSSPSTIAVCVASALCNQLHRSLSQIRNHNGLNLRTARDILPAPPLITLAALTSLPLMSTERLTGRRDFANDVTRALNENAADKAARELMAEPPLESPMNSASTKRKKKRRKKKKPSQIVKPQSSDDQSDASDGSSAHPPPAPAPSLQRPSQATLILVLTIIEEVVSSALNTFVSSDQIEELHEKAHDAPLVQQHLEPTSGATTLFEIMRTPAADVDEGEQPDSHGDDLDYKSVSNASDLASTDWKMRSRFADFFLEDAQAPPSPPHHPSSPLSPPTPHSPPFSVPAPIEQERNAYRDRCLGLEAEVAKLRNILAAKGNMHNTYPQTPLAHAVSNAPHTHGTLHAQYRSTGSSIAGMSENNYKLNHHYAQSEGDRDDVGSTAGTDTRISDDGSVNSDTGSTLRATAPSHVPLLVYQKSASTKTHSICQSRLTKDIFRFVAKMDEQVARSINKRLVACTRIRRVVTALWPRAQVKLYGSHVTNLALPSSDLDFVIVLPAVHKKAMVATPGILEGRNAIRETWQASLARKLRSESWVHSNNIKVIERTLIPVIKISVDGLDLDISFDAADHKGLENIGFVQRVLGEFSHARPLILVLKQCLTNSGLLTAFTGGLSSYGLFLMVTRYLQEQVFSGGMDLGSLLMGFLGKSHPPSGPEPTRRRREPRCAAHSERFARSEQHVLRSAF